MSNDLMNISSFKGLKPSQAFASLDPTSESLADGIGSSYGIIGYKGKVWSLRLRGETYNFVRPDDGSPAAFLDVIVLRSLPTKSKSFYPPGSYVDGQIGTRPLCAALDGVTPDIDIPKPESTACAICPRNVFKISPDGRKTRDCSDYKRMAVLVLPKLTKDLLGAPLMEPVFLRVPAASLNDLALLGEGMSAQGFHFSSFVTRIGFNPEKPHPQMTFRALQPLGDKEAAVVLPLREDPTAFRITGEGEMARKPHAAVAAPQTAGRDIVGDALAGSQQAAIAALAAKKAAEAAAQVEADRVAAHAQAEAAAKAAAAKPVDTGFDVEDAPKTVTAAVKTEAPADDMGFGVTNELAEAANDAVHTVLTQNTVEDTGAPEESDDDLDARIAGILPK